MSSATCPWPGLLAYGIGDAEEFFGRDEAVAACLDRLKTHGVLVVVGPSGSGKSSLVRAGVSAALRRAGRRVVIVTPGTRRPIDALSAFAAEGGEVLVVDQCEEAVSPDVDPVERRAFFAALAIHATKAPLVIALRADRLSEVSAEEDFARLVERGLFLLGPMTESDLRMAIEGPARQAALLLEPGLVDLVVRDVLDEPGALPLMSHSLRQTWTHRQGRTMTVAAYRETGGIRGAVAQSAEALYADIDADERLKLRDLLLRLVSPLDSGEPARARLPRQLAGGRTGVRRAHRAPRQCAAAHERRRGGRSGSRGARAGMAETAGLARRGRRRRARPAPPQSRRRRDGMRSGVPRVSSIAVSDWPRRWSGARRHGPRWPPSSATSSRSRSSIKPPTCEAPRPRWRVNAGRCGAYAGSSSAWRCSPRWRSSPRHWLWISATAPTTKRASAAARRLSAQASGGPPAGSGAAAGGRSGSSVGQPGDAREPADDDQSQPEAVGCGAHARSAPARLRRRCRRRASGRDRRVRSGVPLRLGDEAGARHALHERCPAPIAGLQP